MGKLRLSYTLLSLWMAGKTEEAVNAYLHREGITTPAMELGRTLHKSMEDSVKTYKKFPEWLPQLTLTAPASEQKMIVNYNEMFDLSGVFDIVDGDILYELKTGATDILEWASSLQIPMYFLIAQLASIVITKAYLIHHNPLTKQVEFLIIHNNDTLIAEARNLIDSIGPDIHSFLSQAELI